MKISDISRTRTSSFKTVKRPTVKRRDTTIKHTSRGKFLSCRSKPIESQLTLELLQSLTPYKAGGDVVTQAARELLLNCLQTEPVVHHIFFRDIVKDTRVSVDDLRGFPVERLAVALVADAMARCNDEYKFHCTIDQQELGYFLHDVYSSVHWKKLGFSLYTKLYPHVVRDDKTSVSLNDYIDDGSEWAERLLAGIMAPEWTMSWVGRIVRGVCTEADYNREMNGLFVKLHLLDPQSVIPTFHFLLNQRALPEVSLELATRDYLGGPFDGMPFIKSVEAAISITSLPVNISKLSLNSIEIFCGVEVDEFLVTECRNLGVWNGRRPQNEKTSRVRDRCLVM